MTFPFHRPQLQAGQEYVDLLRKYGNAVASKRQMHSEKPNSTCLKYCKKRERLLRPLDLGYHKGLLPQELRKRLRNWALCSICLLRVIWI